MTDSDWLFAASRLSNNGYFHECLFIFQCLHNAEIPYDAKLLFNAISYVFRYVLEGDDRITVGHLALTHTCIFFNVQLTHPKNCLNIVSMPEDDSQFL